MVENGGRPIGFLGMKITGEGHCEIYVWPLRECEGDQQIQQCLHDHGKQIVSDNISRLGMSKPQND